MAASMGGYDGRTKGKRIRKLQSGSSNRWKFLGANVSDVLEQTTSPKLVKPRTLPRSLSSSAALPTRDARRSTADHGGYDIDGDGIVDARELRLAKFLDVMVARRATEPGARPTAELNGNELLAMRQQAGRLLVAQEFVERNQGHLWRYGSIFTGKDDEQSTEFIAEHKNFKKLMAFLENVERQRSIRSSQQFRGCARSKLVTDQPEQHDSEERQTWVETSRKVRDPTFSKFPLPALQPKKALPHFLSEDDTKKQTAYVAVNTYGAIDVDGDGVIDDDEMKLHLRLQEAAIASSTCDSPGHSRQWQQLEGRRMMAKDFLTRNERHLWHFDSSYKNRDLQDIADEIASSKAFAKDFNRLRAKERVLRLKSSAGVSECLAQIEPPELSEDPSRSLDFRRIRDRTELLRARRELQKPIALQRGIFKGDPDGVHVGAVFAVRENNPRGMERSASECCIGLPRIFDAPRRIEPTGSFSVTKWILDS